RISFHELPLSKPGPGRDRSTRHRVLPLPDWSQPDRRHRQHRSPKMTSQPTENPVQNPSRRPAHGQKLRAALIITAALVVAVLLNLAASRMALRLDLTENKIFTLSQTSQELVRSLDEPIEVHVF